jgi:iron complex outermembrane receptor protein
MGRFMREGRLFNPLGGARLLATASLLAGQAAQGQPASGPAEKAADATLPEVTVTAERVQTQLQKTPVSIGVVEENDIQRRGLYSLSDLVGTIAGVTVPNGFSNMPQAVGIRGVGVSLPAMSQAVGIYVDDVPLIRGYATALWDLPDVKRYEVLRGPQGTLYGQNSTAGAVKIVSYDPGADNEAWLAAGIGNYDTFEMRGYVNQPIGDEGTAASFAFSRRVNDGFAYNATMNEGANKLDATQFRAKLKWNLAGATANLAVDGLKDRSDTHTLNYPLNHPNSQPRVTYTPNSGEFERNAGGVSFKLDGNTSPDLAWRSITAVRSYRDNARDTDFGGLEVQRFSFSQETTQTAFSQEIQLNGRSSFMTWTSATGSSSSGTPKPFPWRPSRPPTPSRGRSRRPTTSASTDKAVIRSTRKRVSPPDSGSITRDRMPRMRNGVPMQRGTAS